MLRNLSDHDKEIVVLPDGRVDLTFSQSSTAPFHIVRSGLETEPQEAVLGAQTVMFAISFKLLATEYIFHDSICDLLNYAEFLPGGFWAFSANDLDDFVLLH